MFRNLIIASVIMASPQIAKAAVFSEFSTPLSAVQDYNGFEVLYQFDPITSISGTITSVQVIASGTLTPGVTNAQGLVTSATITPYVNFSNGQTSNLNTITIPQVSYTGTPQTLPVVGNSTIGGQNELFNFSSTTTNIPYNIFSTPFYQQLTFFSKVNSSTGPGYFPNENYSSTYGGGSLELFVTYDPASIAVPEPASLAMLGIGLLGMIGLSRRKKA